VCSYDRAGTGKSDELARTQSLDEQVGDLHKLLAAAGEKAPYILVGHSIGGIYCRRFVKTYPAEVSGLVFLDSSHEEQMWRLREVEPNGPVPSGAMAEFFYPESGRRLDWRTTAPLVVIMQGKPGPPIAGLTAAQDAGFKTVWRALQEDLAKRSPKTRFMIAKNSGHFIQLDEPELVIQAIRDVMH
jgi:pimeloyl-ACP methyl ester carboxylesterase